MNTTRLSFVVAFSLAGALPAAQGQEPARDAAPLMRLEQTLDADTYRAVVKVIDGARARALPIDPLVDRALEGAMKRAPGARIRAAVSALAQRLEVARNALAPSPTEADIAAGAGALSVGVPRETLRTIRSIQPDRPVAVPLGVLTELVARSVPVDQAATLVVQLLRRGATPAQLVALGEDVQRDIAAGIEPGAAFDLRTRSVASTLGGGEATAVEGGFRDAPSAPTTQSTGGATRGTTPAPRRGTRRP
ncbi:MAG: hypothetical protein M3282_12750 [Gemmatimonadota bacterium]|nr:hypothetical protein [Gemmatimonadota bacterium]